MGDADASGNVDDNDHPVDEYSNDPHDFPAADEVTYAEDFEYAEDEIVGTDDPLHPRTETDEQDPLSLMLAMATQRTTIWITPS